MMHGQQNVKLLTTQFSASSVISYILVQVFSTPSNSLLLLAIFTTLQDIVIPYIKVINMLEIVYFLIISTTNFCISKSQEWFKHREELLYVHMYLRTCRLCRPICQSVNVVSSPLDFHFFFLDSILLPFKISHPWVEVKEKKLHPKGKYFLLPYVFGRAFNGKWIVYLKYWSVNVRLNSGSL